MEVFFLLPGALAKSSIYGEYLPNQIHIPVPIPADLGRILQNGHMIIVKEIPEILGASKEKEDITLTERDVIHHYRTMECNFLSPIFSIYW